MEWWLSIWIWGALVASIVGGVVIREKTSQSHACLVIGQEIASDELLKLTKKGHQDGLSDPRHNFPYFASLILIIALDIIIYLSVLYFNSKL